MNKSKKFLTLIELIVVIVVLGILAAIVIPNISSFKEEAEHTSIVSNVRNLQTSVDMFMLENNGATPTKGVPTIGNPQTLEIHGLHPEHTRYLPNNKGIKWWLDYSSTVWASYVDAPTKVTYNDQSKTLQWKSVEGADLYKIYRLDDSNLSSNASTKKLNLIKDSVLPQENTDGYQRFENLEMSIEHVYLVSAVDKLNFESAPIKAGSQYDGYIKPEKEFIVVNSKAPVNKKPIAVITMTPNGEIYSNSVIEWGYNKSTDDDGDEITGFEWKNKQTNYPTGSHEVELRVQDSKGAWSDWVSISFNVAEPKPVLPTPIKSSVPNGWVGIYTIEDLGKLRGGGGQHILMNNLDFTKEPYNTINWDPIYSYSGTFDGNGLRINGIKILSGKPYVGFISEFGSNGKIMNLELSNVNITGNNNATGGIVAYMSGGQITDSKVSGSITGLDAVGGIAGYTLNGSRIERTTVDVVIQGKRQGAGGIAGTTYESFIKNSYVEGKISGVQFFGGIVGHNRSTEVKYSYSIAETISGGGIAGHHSNVYFNMVELNYWDKEATKTTVDAVESRSTKPSIGKTTSEMYLKNTFIGWDFINTWEIEEGKDYPKLRWEIR